VLCDEPTGNLDRDTADTVMSLVLDLHARHKTIMIVVTHSDRVAGRLSRQWRMERGMLSVDG
jgi:ABC-type lipoprotein export system ATPase subunit